MDRMNAYHIAEDARVARVDKGQYTPPPPTAYEAARKVVSAGQPRQHSTELWDELSAQCPGFSLGGSQGAQWRAWFEEAINDLGWINHQEPKRPDEDYPRGWFAPKDMEAPWAVSAPVNQNL